MSKTIQIRDVPEALYRKLEVRAVMAGMSLSDHLLAVVRALVDRPSRAELLERMRRPGSVELSSSAAEIIAAERRSR